MINNVFLNGKILPEQEAAISPLDRGFLFGDGVYEVIPVYAGKVFCLQQHLQRLHNSCAGIRLDNPYSNTEWQQYIQQLLNSNQHNGVDQLLYLQITRGAPASRDHLFPINTSPTTFMSTKPLPVVNANLLSSGAKLITTDEIRWSMCHLKTISLVANVLLKQMAHDANADEVILIRDGFAQECAASNFFIVSDGVVRTPPKSHYLLPGITRDFILGLLQENKVAYIEENITQDDIYHAEEIWLCSSTKEVLPVTQLNNKPVGNGKPGKLWQQIYQLFQANKV